jgi:hypothetical protein
MSTLVTTGDCCFADDERRSHDDYCDTLSSLKEVCNQTGEEDPFQQISASSYSVPTQYLLTAKTILKPCSMSRTPTRDMAPKHVSSGHCNAIKPATSPTRTLAITSREIRSGNHNEGNFINATRSERNAETIISCHEPLNQKAHAPAALAMWKKAVTAIG